MHAHATHPQLQWTKQRKAIQKILIDAEEPLSIDALVQKGKGVFDRATAFRTIKLFHEHGLVTECRTRINMKSYEWVDAKTHHHHVVCLRCEKNDDIELPEKLLSEHVTRKAKGFSLITGHTIEFFGICTSCARS